jgi:hypothetical protein
MGGHKIFERLRKNRDGICTLRDNREDALPTKMELLRDPDVRWISAVPEFERLRCILKLAIG